MKLLVGVPLVLMSSHSAGHVKLYEPITAFTVVAALTFPTLMMRVLLPLKMPAPLSATALWVTVDVWKESVDLADTEP